ncbi:Crp/Fnr family transcriptional regulator [Flavobacterium subsaxonicum]|uniref:Cyclic nucleotide-binding domain-containing protein n=1 Tax=Flavobacterium subsaxonicum WB 4.1-42 = DSM 21790 TaxID=1121898 RepID=A0A0A2MMR5_9FLAO|nr:Crp/Fnr family transcriptional regulator [Flavobacterium subsaxonicum]KGO93599.1 hypothetical protein Q766_06435 [Flavobacterium subsaxonicum WB 4.1-42 = DSM 21790]
MEYAAFLRSHFEELITISDKEFEIAQSFFRALKLPKKESIIKIGQKVTSEYLVVQGCLKSSAYDEKGKEYIIQFAQENWWVSDYPAYALQSSSELDIQAVEDSFVLELTIENRKKLCDAIPQVHTFFERKTFGGYVGSQKRVLSLLRNSAKEKYDLLLAQYPELFQRLPQKVIAQYLGITRETLSRLGRK